MLAAAGRRTAARCCGREALVIQDTTVIRSAGGGGEYLHAVLALDAADGGILGLVDGQVLSRSAGRRGQRRHRPIEEKESFRWLEGAERAASVCAGARRITVVSDREGDIYEAFAMRPEGVDLLVRSAQDRSLAERAADESALFAALEALPAAAHADLDLPAQPGRRGRTARLALRFGALSPRRLRPARRSGAACDRRRACP